MAKLKKRSKISQHRHKANQLVNPKVLNNEIKPLDAQISQLFADLNSQNDEKRSQSLASLTLLCDANSSIRKLALKNNLTKIILSTHITDPNFSIRSGALGLLRNLVIEEEYDMAIHLWRNDIWLVLENGFKSIDLTQGNQFEYLDSLIGLLDALCMELTIEIVNEQIVPRLSEKSIMKLLFESLNVFIVREEAPTTELNSLVVSILQLFFDISSISTKFLQSLASEFNYMQASGPLFSKLSSNTNLAKIYVIGTNFQICEFNNDLANGQVNQVIIELFNIINQIDINKTIEYIKDLSVNPNKETDATMKANFQIIDTSLDLFTTMIEYTGSSLEMQKGNKGDKFTALVVNQLIPFVKQLIVQKFKNEKLLVCLNNALVYLTSIENMTKEDIQLIGEQLSSMNDVLTDEFVKSIEKIEDTSSLTTIEHLCDLISFKFNVIDFASNKNLESKVNLIKRDESLGLIDNLLKLSNKLINYSTLDLNDKELDMDVDVLVQYTTTLIPYLTVIAKYCANDELTKSITQYIVDQLLIQPVTFYKNKLTPNEFNTENEVKLENKDKKKKKKNGGKLTTAKYHAQYGYLIESTLNDAINSVFELFDDNYSYNVSIYHNGGLHEVLSSILPEYKIIYKNIDKNQQIGLKKRSEDTLMNLGRFILYKKTELN